MWGLCNLLSNILIIISCNFMLRDVASLNISLPQTVSDTIWVSDVTCNGSEVCLSSCLSLIPSRPLQQCSNEIGVRCCKLYECMYVCMFVYVYMCVTVTLSCTLADFINLFVIPCIL